MEIVYFAFGYIVIALSVTWWFGWFFGRPESSKEAGEFVIFGLTWPLTIVLVSFILAAKNMNPFKK